jgi:hypothetical protein
MMHVLILKMKTIIAKDSTSTIANNAEIISDNHTSFATLQVFSISSNGAKRISIITDSINEDCLHGNVKTAIIFAALLAESSQAHLRIVTCAAAPQPDNIDHLLLTYGIHLSEEVEFSFNSSPSQNNEINIFDNELFVTTSLQTTYATMASIRHDLIIYLVEKNANPSLERNSIHLVLDEHLLFEHLINHGLSDMTENVFWLKNSDLVKCILQFKRVF